MPYELQYLADNQVILQRVIGEYSLEDVKAASYEMTNFASSSDKAVYVLCDMSETVSTPIQLAAIRDAMKPMLSTPQIKLIAIYGASNLAIINFMLTVLSALFKVPFKLFNDANSAVEHLLEAAPHLNPQLAKDMKKLSG